MNTDNYSYRIIDPIIGFSSGIIFFLEAKDIIPNFLNVLALLAFASYFFPLKTLLFRRDETDRKGRLKDIFTDYFFYILLCGSVLISVTYDRENIIRNIFIAASAVNVGLMIYHYFKGSGYYFVLTHFSFTFLSAAVLIT